MKQQYSDSTVRMTEVAVFELMKEEENVWDEKDFLLLFAIDDGVNIGGMFDHLIQPELSRASTVLSTDARESRCVI